MNRAFRFILLALALSLVASCATSGPKYTEYKSVIAPPKPEVGRIYLSTGHPASM